MSTLDSKRINGKVLADSIKEDLKIKIIELKNKYNIVPGLAVGSRW